MATTVAQRRWREKNRYVKTQLNVMTRRLVHEDLSEISDSFRLRGKGEAVSFASFVTKGLLQFAENDDEAQRLLEIFTAAYARDRDLYQ